VPNASESARRQKKSFMLKSSVFISHFYHELGTPKLVAHDLHTIPRRLWCVISSYDITAFYDVKNFSIEILEHIFYNGGRGVEHVQQFETLVP
jgi:hypothetical protein